MERNLVFLIVYFSLPINYRLTLAFLLRFRNMVSNSNSKLKNLKYKLIYLKIIFCHMKQYQILYTKLLYIQNYLLKYKIFVTSYDFYDVFDNTFPLIYSL